MKDKYRQGGKPDRRHWKSDKRRATDRASAAPADRRGPPDPTWAAVAELADNVWDLLIDYDRLRDVPGMEVDEGPEPDVDRLQAILHARLGRAGFVILAFELCPSTNGWHTKIRLSPSPAPVESVALQAICGSDPSRESCNLQRARDVEKWARDVEEHGTEMGREAVEFWRTRWNVLYAPNPNRKATK